MRTTAAVASALAFVLVSGSAHATISLGPSVEPRGPGRAALIWESSSAAPTTVTLTSPGRPEVRGTSTVSGGFHRIDFDTLEPGVEYTYRVEDREGRFISPPAANQDVRFAIFGDSRDGDDVHRRLVERVATLRPDFYLLTGDAVPSGSQLSEWRRFFDIERPLMSTTSFLSVQGNHDTGSYFPVIMQLHSDTQGASTTWGSMDIGPVHFVLIDTEEIVTPGSPQYAFIERDLAAHQSKALVVLLHKPLFSSGWHGGAENPRIAASLAPLFQRYGVDVVFQGHDHHYERSNPINGVTYVVTGGAGAPLRGVGRSAWTAVAESVNHYIMVEASASRLRVVATRLDGSQLDAFEIDPRANDGRFDANATLPAVGGQGCSIAGPLGATHGAAALVPAGTAFALLALRRARCRRGRAWRVLRSFASRSARRALHAFARNETCSQRPSLATSQRRSSVPSGPEKRRTK